MNSPAEKPDLTVPSASFGTWTTRDWMYAAALAIAVILAYLPVWNAGFVWDDLVFLLPNPSLTGPHGLQEIWTTSAADICPLTLTTFYFEHALWGFSPRPFHIVNVLLHAASAILLWRVLLSLRIPGAWLGAALWALHPVNVESVAWITELKNTQSGLFFLLSLLFFLTWLRSETSPHATKAYACMLVCAFLAMTSKSSTVILPVVLCLCAWWIERRLRGRIVAAVVPVFLLSFAASLLSLWTQKIHLGAVSSHWQRTLPERIVAAGDAVWFYLGKLLWPHPLVAIYPRWQIETGNAVSYLPGLAVISIIAILWLNSSRGLRPWFFAFALFLVALLPVLGLFENFIFRYSLVFDHFQYLASMAPLALLGAGFSRVALPGHIRFLLGFLLLAVLGLLTWQRAQVFHNEQTLWTDTLAHNPDCWSAHGNLGLALVQSGHIDDAIMEYQKALAVNPDLAKVHNDLGSLYLQKNEVDRALVEYKAALDIDPQSASAHYDLALALSHIGKNGEALDQYRDAVQIDPSDGNAHNNLGIALGQAGRVDEALAEFQKAVLVSPENEPAHRNLANAHLQKGELDAAIEQYQQALALDPNDIDCRTALAITYGRKGEFPAAVTQFREILRLKPDDVDAQRDLATALSLVHPTIRPQ